MINNKKIIFGMFLLVLSLTIISAAGEQSYCCERTIVETDGSGGIWCMNAPLEKCDSNYRKAPTSCESTSYCKRGCCFDSQEGTCLENTPQKVCEDGGGVWDDDAECDIGQCALGCCLMGDQAAFVTQTRCKRLSSFSGLEIDFRKSIQSEIMCIASVTSDVKGACVYSEELERTCKFITKKECDNMKKTNTNVSFYEGTLCSDERLGTNCGPTEQTTCVDGEDEVFFVDSCGNVANIYDAQRIGSKEYWATVYDKSESCNPTESNANSNDCGNCDYYLGSTCKSADRGGNPIYGSNICEDLSCEYNNKRYEHGETWCATSLGTNNEPGSRYFRLVCYNGDVTVEPCADYRAEFCLESDIEGFSTASCIVNKWQACASYGDESTCTNADTGDCTWIGGEGVECVPKYSPGNAAQCSQANDECEVTYRRGRTLSGGKEEWKCIENCECLRGSWESDLEESCIQMGDCVSGGFDTEEMKDSASDSSGGGLFG